jgi:ribosomal protein L35AE/L33A
MGDAMRRRRRATMRARRVGARLAHARGHRCAHTTVKSNRARYREGRAHRDTRVCSLPAENIGNRGNSREERWNKLAELCTWYYRVTGNTVTVPVFRVVHHGGRGGVSRWNSAVRSGRACEPNRRRRCRACPSRSGGYRPSLGSHTGTVCQVRRVSTAGAPPASARAAGAPGPPPADQRGDPCVASRVCASGGLCQSKVNPFCYRVTRCSLRETVSSTAPKCRRRRRAYMCRFGRKGASKFPSTRRLLSSRS